MDINADAGEGGARDEALFAGGISSANVACGGHAGDAFTMAAACALAARHGVALGAHPGYADRANFGRRELALSLAELTELFRGQGEVLAGAAHRAGIRPGHVKPHGALYHFLHQDRAAAEACARVVAAGWPDVALVGLPEGEWRAAAGRVGLGYVAEGFLDRAYRLDGTLVARGQPGAVLTEEAAVVAQALALAQAGRVRTLCVHGDGPDAVRFLGAARRALTAAGFTISAARPE
ncbi:MAG: LamB/YcsF family protein [Verrucomicrobia bacterium]|nr:LamB/YcsF family protein [Verrucomicrobiota bacterium]